MAHTPGPWHANVPEDERYADGSTIREAHHGDIIATVARPLLAKGDVIANARLIAAVPDLVAIVRRISQRQCTGHVHINDVHDGPGERCEPCGARALLARLA